MIQVLISRRFGVFASGGAGFPPKGDGLRIQEGVGEVPMVCRARVQCVAVMTTTTQNNKDNRRVVRAEEMEELQPWKMALPPRIGGPQHFGVREEWRPGVGDVRRGYERAVAEWWWI